MTGDDVRDRLGTALDEVVPSPAPVAAVMRKGKVIRVRRRVGVAAGLAVVVAAAVVVPGLLRGVSHQPPVNRHVKPPKVTIGRVGAGDPRGLIAKGTIDGRPWTIRLSHQGNLLCDTASSSPEIKSCSPAGDYGVGTSPVTFQSSGGGGSTVTVMSGPVERAVSRVSLYLSDGAVLSMHPVSFVGHRWVGAELPGSLSLVKVVAYSRRGELAYAIPFNDGDGIPNLVDWLRPGQAVPGVVTKVVGVGIIAGKHWSGTVHIGPWGWCLVPAIAAGPGMGCWSGQVHQYGKLMSSSAGSKSPWLTIGAVRPSVSYLRLWLTHGGTQRIDVVRVDGRSLYMAVFVGKPRASRWGAFDSVGRRLYGGVGTPSWATM